jgi:predicted dehydrogenase
VPAPSPLPEVDARPTVMVDSITHVLDCLAGRATPLCSGVDGLRSIEIIEAITASARSGRGRVELRLNSTV